MTLNYGWIYVAQSGTNMQLACKMPWELHVTEDPYVEPLPGDTRISYNLQTIWRKIILKEVIFKTLSDAETCIANLKTMNGAGTFTIKGTVNSDGSIFHWNGSQSTLNVYYKDYVASKIAPADGTVYTMKKITFVEG